MNFNSDLNRRAWRLARKANGGRSKGSKAFFGWAMKEAIKEAKKTTTKAQAKKRVVGFTTISREAAAGKPGLRQFAVDSNKFLAVWYPAA